MCGSRYEAWIRDELHDQRWKHEGNGVSFAIWSNRFDDGEIKVLPYNENMLLWPIQERNEGRAVRVTPESVCGQMRSQFRLWFFMCT